jgi:hypothetical protein
MRRAQDAVAPWSRAEAVEEEEEEADEATVRWLLGGGRRRLEDAEGAD